VFQVPKSLVSTSPSVIHHNLSVIAHSTPTHRPFEWAPRAKGDNAVSTYLAELIDFQSSYHLSWLFRRLFLSLPPETSPDFKVFSSLAFPPPPHDPKFKQ
jgi:hypothetical protein